MTRIGFIPYIIIELRDTGILVFKHERANSFKLISRKCNKTSPSRFSLHKWLHGQHDCVVDLSQLTRASFYSFLRGPFFMLLQTVTNCYNFAKFKYYFNSCYKLLQFFFIIYLFLKAILRIFRYKLTKGKHTNELHKYI